MRTSRSILLLGLVGSTATTADAGEDPRAAITVRLERPDGQLRAILDLFRGSRAAHPAAALAAWKRASVEPNRLGKPLEALIAAFNPDMVDEVRTLDGAEVALWFEPETGRAAWGAVLPRDDGSFAALATALVLSGGAAEPAVDGLAVDRLGPPGSPLMARSPRGLLVAGSLGGLKEARVRAEKPDDRDPWGRLRLDIEPGALDGSRPLMLRRAGALLGQARGPVSGRIAVVGPKLHASITVGVDGPERPPSVDPDWLDWLPLDRAMAAFAVAIDPSPTGWDAAFRVADLVERLDPARASLAPARLRLGLLAGSMGLRVDGDLLPHLRGVAGWVGGDGKAVDRAFLMLHLDAEAVAVRVYEGLRRLPNPGAGPGPPVDSGRWLGRVGGRVIRAHRVGRSVVATWGDRAMEAGLEAASHRERSARATFAGPLAGSPSLVAAAWPARVPGLLPPDTPLLLAVAEGPPVVVSGAWGNPGALRIEADWPGLDDVVRRFLDKLPLDPPPDH